jgi:hypothetical protein
MFSLLLLASPKSVINMEMKIMLFAMYAQASILVAVPIPEVLISDELVAILTQGGVAIFTIFAIAYLIQSLVRLVEVSRESNNK